MGQDGERTKRTWTLLLVAAACSVLGVILMATAGGVGMVFGIIFIVVAIGCMYARSRIEKEHQRKVEKKEAIRRQMDEVEETEAMRREILEERKRNRE